MKILKENLQAALLLAIDAQKKIEEKRRYTNPSALVQGWSEVYWALERGEYVEVGDQ